MTVLEQFEKLVAEAYSKGATDLHIRIGGEVWVRIGGNLRKDKKADFDTKLLQKLAAELLEEQERRILSSLKTVKGIREISQELKFRYHFSFERSKLYMNVRLLPGRVRTWEMLDIPSLALNFLNKKQGLILISGPLSSGKTSTLASFTEYLNHNRREHIIFIDEVVEHRVKSDRCIVNMRQLHSDTESYTTALKYALREDPDIIVLGEINDAESAEIAINIAETGHLVIAGVSTLGALNTVMRVLNCFPARNLENARLKLSAYLIGIISQVLIPDSSAKRLVPLFEVMTITPSIANNIRSERMNQLKAEFSRSVKGVSLCFEDCADQLKTKGLLPPTFDISSLLRML